MLSFLLNGLDIIATYYVSPSLEFEQNGWVKYLSLDFNGLVDVLIFTRHYIYFRYGFTVSSSIK